MNKWDDLGVFPLFLVSIIRIPVIEGGMSLFPKKVAT